MIIVKEKKMKKAFVCIRSKKVRMNTRDVPWITQHPEKGTGLPQKRGGLSTI